MHSHIVSVYAQHDVQFTHGKGTYLFDVSGKEYLDFLSGISVTNLGHSNDELIKVAETQLKNYWHTSNLFHSNLQEELASKLGELSGLDFAFFSNSGTEANEAAIKFARKVFPDKYKIISMKNGFHGRTYGSLSATGQPSLQRGFSTMLNGFEYADFASISSIETLIDDQTCAILLEPIQGEAGIHIPYEGYLKDVKDLCDKHDLLLILDEVQTGLGRTGKHFAFQWEHITPDIVTLAKGIANGLPLGTTLISDKVNSSLNLSDHGSTFGGNPVAVSVASKVLELIDTDLLQHINEIGDYLAKNLNSIPLIAEVRRKGLMFGIELSHPVSMKKLCRTLLENGVLVGTSGDNVLRLLPPFIIQKKDVDLFIEKFTSVLPKIEEKEEYYA